MKKGSDSDKYLGVYCDRCGKKKQKCKCEPYYSGYCVGPTGPTGADGRDGRDGVTGPTGADGRDGAQGIPGPDGATGPTGASGINGATGPQGIPGINGATGPTGANGINGSDGSNGATGPTGSAGANGINGATGPTGPTGASGINGATGPQGIPGINGVTGPQGIPGINGVTGPQGIPGINGATGPTGPVGDEGNTGPTGPPGSPGRAGIDGIQGPTGPSGYRSQKFGHFTFINNTDDIVLVNIGQPIQFDKERNCNGGICLSLDLHGAINLPKGVYMITLTGNIYSSLGKVSDFGGNPRIIASLGTGDGTTTCDDFNAPVIPSSPSSPFHHTTILKNPSDGFLWLESNNSPISIPCENPNGNNGEVNLTIIELMV